MLIESFSEITFIFFFAGKEADDNRLMTEADDATLSVTVNSPGTYRTGMDSYFTLNFCSNLITTYNEENLAKMWSFE